jgi:hypothetical protein
MELKDFRRFILDSPIKDKLRSLKITLNYPHLNSKIELEGIESIYKFTLSQVKGWNHLENIPEYLKHSKTFFENFKSNIIRLTDFVNENTHQQFDNHWNRLVSQFTGEKSDNRYYIFLYDSAETDFLLKINNKNQNFTQGAIDYFTNGSINLNNNREYFTGILLGYEFKNQTDSELHHRRNNEKISLAKIRDRYNEYIVEAEQQLNGYLSDSKENLTTHFETIDKLKAEKDKNFEDWFNGIQTGFDIFFKKANDNIKSNEELYREKLRLEAPADYWKKRGKVLKSDGQKFLIWLIILIVFAANCLFILLFQIPDGMLLKVFDDKVTAIKWSIILVTMVSLLAYGIKILARLTFSSYHLSRDAEEREQLTHFYLALKQDTSVTDNDRQLILQSLFSRADSGLLKEDSSPTMPTSGIIDRLKP